MQSMDFPSGPGLFQPWPFPFLLSDQCGQVDFSSVPHRWSERLQHLLLFKELKPQGKANSLLIFQEGYSASPSKQTINEIRTSDVPGQITIHFVVSSLSVKMKRYCTFHSLIWKNYFVIRDHCFYFWASNRKRVKLVAHQFISRIKEMLAQLLEQNLET